MPDFNPAEAEFLNQVSGVIEKNISVEQFGVSELADAMNMSRSNLLRKVKKATKLSVSQLISQIRLEQGMELLRTSSLNVSEVSHQVGFSSTSYFIKCFREYYGYPPGEVGKNEKSEPKPVALPAEAGSNKKRDFAIGSILTVAVLITLALITYYRKVPSQTPPVEKSIAVLPFKNDSNDSTNVYLINGLMESTLNSLQLIKDLRVISRTSAEKYRNTTKSIPEMAKELNALYFVEGSGQKIGDKIVLNIQLIDAGSDRHLWSKQYRRETKDIFALQQEIAKNIADEIKAIITPLEENRLKKIPTENLEAYDLYLKGLNLMNNIEDENLKKAITYFKEAIAKDPQFALAYAETAIALYYLDAYKAEKKFIAEIGSYADKALLYDSKLGESLVAKALFYTHQKEYEQALPYLEKAHEYNPNSAPIIGYLADYYSNYMPNTGKYIEYALKGIRLGIASSDSITTSYVYLRLGNALIQAGFVDESIKYLNKSLDYNPNNPFTRYVQAFVAYAKNGNINETKELLLKEFNKDTSRIDILQDIGKICYYMKQYDSSYKYYKRFIRIRETKKLDVYQHENLIIGTVLAKVGQTKKSEELLASYKQFVDNEKSIYKELGLAGYYCNRGENQKGLEHLKLFSKEDNLQYWIILFFQQDPIMENANAEFKAVNDRIVKKFWSNHKKIKAKLEEEGLLKD